MENTTNPSKEQNSWEAEFNETDFGFVMNAKPMKNLKDFIKQANSKAYQAGREDMLKEIEEYAEKWQDALPYDFIQEYKISLTKEEKN